MNVSARIEPTGTPSRSTASTQRSAITAVLPEPALAASSAEPARSSIAARCSGVNGCDGDRAHPPALQIVGYAQPFGEHFSGHARTSPACSAAAVSSARVADLVERGLQLGLGDDVRRHVPAPATSSRTSPRGRESRAHSAW